ncbi:LytR/AlgR family response regulator transcription factor [Paraglaciecola hydrolytica]|uniref:Two-component system response regulator n=1 Tax=Paraglaciecola hydrolytica TaxID=1799789 RepID=A0A136A684_9ALTE|nr:LytTR family DNA-binding domain-containing protein [Paraglaciecola hydrolytica]KXI30736.1 two-component system response regulator [Paraglaciecola hydrolytica]
MKINTLIVDDEPLARKGLSLRLAEFDNINLLGECKNGLDAVALIPQLRPDLVFLDIQMPGLNGFQVINKLKELKQPIPIIIFVTAFDSYAIKAFDIHALDYVLKPVDEQRLRAAVAKVEQYLAMKNEGDNTHKLIRLVADFTGDDCEDILRKLAAGEKIQSPHYPDILAIKDGSEVTRVPVSDIHWVDAAGDYMCVHTSDQTHIMRRTMKELDQQLDPRKFVRVHRSAIVNISFVQKLVSHISGEYHLILSNGSELKVSRSHRDRVKEMINL